MQLALDVQLPPGEQQHRDTEDADNRGADAHHDPRLGFENRAVGSHNLNKDGKEPRPFAFDTYAKYVRPLINV